MQKLVQQGSAYFKDESSLTFHDTPESHKIYEGGKFQHCALLIKSETPWTQTENQMETQAEIQVETQAEATPSDTSMLFRYFQPQLPELMQGVASLVKRRGAQLIALRCCNFDLNDSLTLRFLPLN